MLQNRISQKKSKSWIFQIWAITSPVLVYACFCALGHRFLQIMKNMHVTIYTNLILTELRDLFKFFETRIKITKRSSDFECFVFNHFPKFDY